jgi:alpha-ribazole phosphatase/probable phosphoglycerate mutase
MKITFFAHSTTTDNQAGHATGWLQGELSDKGEEQAKLLPSLVKDASFGIVFCSDLKRAIDSAELGFGKTHKIRTDWRLREANYGDFDGTDKSFKANMTTYINTPYPNGESYHDAEKRIRSFLNDISQELGDSVHIAIIGHEATQLALEVIINGKSWQQVIAENWRPQQKWQPGWTYNYSPGE